MPNDLMPNDSTLPRVTIGLPIYNGELYVEEAIRSLLSQSFADLELVISDNCSTDMTAEICTRFAEQDPRVHYYRNEHNIGAAANFNRVVGLARAPYFAWANHDDLWADTYLEKCVEALERNQDAVLAYTRSAKIDDQGEIRAPLMSNLALDHASPARRLARYHDHFRDLDRRGGWRSHELEGLWTPIYGVIRTEQLRKTCLIGSYISSDTVLLEELLMLGRFIELEEMLFFKRDHAGRSMRDSVAYSKRMAWFTGKTAGRLLFPRWRMFWERLRAAGRVDLTVGNKIGCFSEMLAFYVRRPHEGKALVKECLINLKNLISSRSDSGNAVQKW